MSGLEAIGIAASIIQVADLGTKLSVKLFSFYRRIKNANESIQLLSNEIALVSAILRELGDHLKDESAQLCSDEAFSTLRLVLKECRDVLRQIQKVVDSNDRSGKSRFQQATGKIRFVVLESSLDQLKVKLERLKSTMLLLLNVIMYADQIRSKKVPTLVQEQRDLIQSLLDNQEPRQLDNAAESSRGLSTETTRVLADGRSIMSNDQEHDLDKHPPIKRQSSQGLRERANSSGPRIKANRASEEHEPTELEEYNMLVQSILDEIESCKSKLEQNRHSRIKNGVLNIHSGEIIRFQIEHGSSVYIDHSLFAEQITEFSLKPKSTGPSLALTSSRHSSRSNKLPVYSHCELTSEESDFSETDLSIHGQESRTFRHRHSFSRHHRPGEGRSASTDGQPSREQVTPAESIGNEQAQHTGGGDNDKPRRVQQRVYFDSDEDVEEPSRRHAASSISREGSPYHRDSELVAEQRMLEKSDIHGNFEIWQHQQEIERLERELEKARMRNALPRRPRLPPYENDDNVRLHRLQRFERKVQLGEDKLSKRPCPQTYKNEEAKKEVARKEWRDAKVQPINLGIAKEQEGKTGMKKSKEQISTEEKQQAIEEKIKTKKLELESLMEKAALDEWKMDQQYIERSPKAHREHGSTDGSSSGQSYSWDGTLMRRRSFDRERPQRLSPHTQLVELKRLPFSDNDEGSVSENSLQERPFLLSAKPEESELFGECGDDTQREPVFEGLSLPGNLEDLLARWTTLDKREIRRGQASAV